MRLFRKILPYLFLLVMIGSCCSTNSLTLLEAKNECKSLMRICMQKKIVSPETVVADSILFLAESVQSKRALSDYAFASALYHLSIASHNRRNAEKVANRSTTELLAIKNRLQNSERELLNLREARLPK